ncbi:MAG: L,D-transpeptidase [bacterium]|nr:L,D-transpeptidase [bacterium]
MRRASWPVLGLLVALSGAALAPAAEVRRHALATVEIDLAGPPGHSTLVVRFALPAGRYQWRPRVTVTADPPEPAPRVAETWVDPYLLVVTVVEPEPPFGRELRYRIRAGGGWAFRLGPDLTGSYRQPVTPAILGVEPEEPVPTRGPVFLRFSTEVDPDQTRVRLEPETGGTLGPVPGDPTRWRFDPRPPLANATTYRFLVEPGLTGPGGTESGPLEISFRTAEAVRWLSYPRGPLPLYPGLEAVADRELDEAYLALVGVPGQTVHEGSRVAFRPARALLPGTRYVAQLRGVAGGEQAPDLWLSLETEELPGYWLEVCLTPPQVVRVHHGRELIRVMAASAGGADKPTPAGVFRVGGRGESFWNPRYGEGAYYWVRFQGSYLFHSVPFDATGDIIALEELKLGWPASHGCVRLDLVNARWLYENVPDGSPVIIHP